MTLQGFPLIVALLVSARVAPETTQVNLPTLQLGEYVIYGIDTLHLRRAPVALWPTRLAFPEPPWPAFPTHPFLTVRPLPVATLTPRKLPSYPRWEAQMSIGSYPSTSVTLNWQSPSESGPSFSGLFSYDWSRGHVPNAQRSIWQGQLNADLPTLFVPIQASLNTGYARFGYYMLDTTLQGSRRLLDFTLDAYPLQWDRAQIRGHMEFQRHQQSLGSLIPQVTHQIRRVELSGNVDRPPWTVLTWRLGIQSREFLTSPLPEPSFPTQGRQTESHLAIGIRTFWRRWTFHAEVGLSHVGQSDFPNWPLLRFRMVNRLAPTLNLGLEAFSLRRAEPQHLRWLYILPLSAAFERQSGLAVLAAYTSPTLKVQSRLAYMHRGEAEYVVRRPFAVENPVRFFMTTTGSFRELQWQATGSYRLSPALQLRGRLLFRFPSDSLPYEPRAEWTLGLRWQTPFRRATTTLQVHGEDRYLYTDLGVQVPIRTLWALRGGVRNLFDQPDGIFGRQTGGRREVYFMLTWQKEVVP